MTPADLDTVLENTTGLWARLPEGLQALLMIFGGWMLALAVKHLCSSLLSLARFDRAWETTGVKEFLRKGKVSYTPSRLAGLLIFWAVLGTAVAKASQKLNLDITRTLQAHLAETLPMLFATSLYAVLGLVLVIFLANVVGTLLNNAGFAHGDLVARVIKWAGVLVICSLALEQLNFGRTLLSPLLLIAFGATAFGAALAFGLGCKDLARESVVRLLAKLRERQRAAAKTDMED